MQFHQEDLSADKDGRKVQWNAGLLSGKLSVRPAHQGTDSPEPPQCGREKKYLQIGLAQAE